MTDAEIIEANRRIARGAGGDVRLAAATVALIERLQSENEVLKTVVHESSTPMAPLNDSRRVNG